MNTPTHLLVAAAAFARPGARRRNAAALFGGVLPDLSLYALVAWDRFMGGLSFREIFDERYFSALYTSVFAIDNSAPLYTLLAAVALMTGASPLAALSGAALLHIALDLPFHHDDGRAHFQPFTDWVYDSPFSYWDVRHHGATVGALETFLVLALCVLLWRRFNGWKTRTVLVFAAAAQLATGAFWRLVFA